MGVRIQYQEGEATAGDLVRYVAEHPLRGRAVTLHQAPLVSGDHALRYAFQNAARELVAGQKLFSCSTGPRRDGGRARCCL
jgi:hypothetical protein